MILTVDIHWGAVTTTVMPFMEDTKYEPGNLHKAFR